VVVGAVPPASAPADPVVFVEGAVVSPLAAVDGVVVTELVGVEAVGAVTTGRLVSLGATRSGVDFGITSETSLSPPPQAAMPTASRKQARSAVTNRGIS
jgi:hypothetical protein